MTGRPSEPDVAEAGPPWWLPAVAATVDGWFVFFGAWTLLCWSVTLSGASFTFLLRLAWLPLLPAAALLRWRSRDGRDLLAAPAEPLNPAVAGRAGLVAAVAVGAYAVSASYAVFWAVAVGATLAALRRPDPPNVRMASRPESGLALLAACALAAAVTLVAHRPDADDCFYLNVVVTALDHPDAPLLGSDGMYGEVARPLLEPGYRLRSYEPLIAALSSSGAVSPEWLYYLAFPAVFAVLGVVVHWLVLRRMGGPWAAVGAVTVVVVLIVWGDRHEAIGNFGFVRLFQGKGETVTVAVPAAVWYALRFARAPGLRHWLLLGLSQVAAVGMAGSAIVAVPVAAGALLIGWLAGGRSRAGGVLIVGLSASAIAVVAGALIAVSSYAVRERLPALAELPAMVPTTEAAMRTVLGPGGRALLALGALLAAPQMAPAVSRRPLVAYLLVVLLVTLNPFLAGAVSRVYERFAWRLFWSVPFPLLIGLTAQRLAALTPAAGRSRLPAWAAVAALIGAFAFVPGLWSLASANGTRLELPGPKVPPEYALAGAIVGLSDPADLVLAPEMVSTWIPTYRYHPRLVGVRRVYEGPETVEGDTGQRQRLIRAVTSGDPGTAEIVAEIQRRGVRIVVRVRRAKTDPLARELAGLGCGRIGDDELGLSPASVGEMGYEVWRCPLAG